MDKKKHNDVVYAIREIGLPYVKIGLSTVGNICHRMTVFRTCNPHPLQLMFCELSQNGRLTESWYHKRFAYRRLHGEWFMFTENEVRDLLHIHKMGIAPESMGVGNIKEISRALLWESGKGNRKTHKSTDSFDFPYLTEGEVLDLLNVPSNVFASMKYDNGHLIHFEHEGKIIYPKKELEYWLNTLKVCSSSVG